MHKSAATVAGKARRFYYSKDINRRWRVERKRQCRLSIIISVVATLLIQIFSVVATLLIQLVSLLLARFKNYLL